MLLEKVLRGWTQKFTYAFLIFYIGGVDSLVYFDGFLPGHEHGLHPYHLSIGAESRHSHNPLPPPSQSGDLTLLNAVDRNAVHGVVCSCHLSSSHDYLLTIAHSNLLSDSPFFNRLVTASVAERSAWLSPPDKPPQA